MDKKVYYFSVPRSLATFIHYRDNQPVSGYTDHFQRYADAWAKTSHPTSDMSKLGLGPTDKKIGAPDVAIIYGEQVSSLFTWAYKDPPEYRGEIQPYNIVNATVHFGTDILHNSDFTKLQADATGKIQYDAGLLEAWHRYKELQTLARAVDNTSERCRRSLRMDNMHDVAKLRDIYTRTGDCQLQAPDLLSRLTVSVIQKMKDTLPLEFTLHIPEFQQKAQESCLTYDISFPEKPISPEKRALGAIENALEWLEQTVEAENMCTSAEMWQNYHTIRQDIKDLSAKVSVEPNKMPQVFLLEYRQSGQRVNMGVDVKQSLPAFDSWSEMYQHIQTQSNRMYREDPSNAGYFVVYHGHTPKVNSMMSPMEVSLTNTTVYMLGSGLFEQKNFYLTPAIAEQERRLDTWNAIKDFAETHNLEYTDILNYPLAERAALRSVFEPGGILEAGHMIESIDIGHPELKPLRQIQRILCGEHATFDTVRAAIIIEEAYTKNLYNKVQAGMSMQEAIRQEALFAVDAAEHYTQFDPSMPHNDAIYKIFYACKEAGRTDIQHDTLDMLEWYANGCPEEHEYEDV